MQESKCFSDGDGVVWFSQSKYTDEKMTKRDAKVLLRISKVVSGESGRSFYCLNDCTHCWTNKGTQQPTVCPHKALDSCTNPHIFPLLPFINSTFPWADLTNATYDVYYSSKNLNCSSKDMVVILYNDQFHEQSVYRAGPEITAPSVNEDVEHLKRPDVSKHKNNNLNHVINNDYCNNCVCEETKMKPRLKVRRKSVSFADDVIVYLYDKDSPTVRMHPHSSSSSHPLAEVVHDDNSLEWEDDFLVLEKNCHPQTHLEYSGSFNFRSANATIPMRQSLIQSQNCLFLTHITEADLEP